MMWLKHLTVDLLATLVITIVVFFETALLEYVLYIYTGLMLIARSLAFFRIDLRTVTKKKVEEAPIMVYHLLYIVNISILFYGLFYITAISWVYIYVSAMFVFYKKDSTS